MFAYCFYLPLCNSNLTLAQQQGYRWSTATIPLRSGKYNCYVRTRNTHYNFFQLKYQFISSIWHDYLTRISQISQNHTSLSLVCSRPDGKREWNDAFSRDLRDSRETKSCVKREYFYNAFSLCIYPAFSYWRKFINRLALAARSGATMTITIKGQLSCGWWMMVDGWEIPRRCTLSGNIGYRQINLQFFWCLLINKIRFPNKRRSAFDDSKHS